jgi:predicted dehydrogenase
MNAAELRTAVIGSGHFGRFHAEKYARLRGCRLIAVVDRDLSRAEATARQHGALALADYRQLFGRVDAVSIVVPTQAHYEIARDCLEADLHVLVEKPIAETLEQADRLIQLAAERRRVLQIGHLQRFFLERLDAGGLIRDPLYIESYRIAPYKQRGTDVGVTLDLMIHDIDLVLSFVREPVVSVDAVGAPVVSAEEDVANSRLHFANGCVANITASRVSLKTERKLRIFQRESYVSIDLEEGKLVAMRKGTGRSWFPGLPPIDREERSVKPGDDLAAEIASFLDAIRSGKPPLVTGEDGRRALAAAMMITESLRRNLALAAGIGRS